MKKLRNKFLLVSFFLIVLSACAPSQARISFQKLPKSFSETTVGGYSADILINGTKITKNQYYYWNENDFGFLKGGNCVEVGTSTQKIILYYSEGYEWKKGAGSNYCLSISK